MRKQWAAVAAALTTVFLSQGAAHAADGPVVVELYTSQGCSSCPPADAYLADELVGRDDVLALALHVDYWDYIGWKDMFGSPAFTARQKAYAARAGHRTIYTPQMIVGGVDHVVGFKPMQLAKLVTRHRAAPDRVKLSATRSGGQITVTAQAIAGAGPLPTQMIVQLVRYTPRKDVEITRGENAGRTISYRNIVTALDQIAPWDGRGTFTADVPSGGDSPSAVIVQGQDAGPVIAAAYTVAAN